MLLLINKPKGLTSHDVVNAVRRVTGERRVGHAGTLDPNATGLLIVGVGRESTKKLSDISTNKDKVYVAEIFLGEEKDTDDPEGQTINRSDKVPTLPEVKKALASFKGNLDQTPPPYSAIKIKGKKAYELARKGEVPVLKSRKITVHNLSLLSFNYPTLEIEFRVSSGTYIRSLARDIGRALGTYGYLRNLKRTKIGEFDLKDAVNVEDLQDSWQKKNDSHKEGQQ